MDIHIYLIFLYVSVDLKCYEENNQIGGIWSDPDSQNQFFDEMYLKHYGTTFSSVYENLITNGPRLFLMLNGFPPSPQYS